VYGGCTVLVGPVHGVQAAPHLTARRGPGSPWQSPWHVPLLWHVQPQAEFWQLVRRVDALLGQLADEVCAIEAALQAGDPQQDATQASAIRMRARAHSLQASCMPAAALIGAQGCAGCAGAVDCVAAALQVLRIGGFTPSSAASEEQRHALQMLLAADVGQLQVALTHLFTLAEALGGAAAGLLGPCMVRLLDGSRMLSPQVRGREPASLQGPAPVLCGLGLP
jgi:hypothetical protein